MSDHWLTRTDANFPIEAFIYIVVSGWCIQLKNDRPHIQTSNHMQRPLVQHRLVNINPLNRRQ